MVAAQAVAAIREVSLSRTVLAAAVSLNLMFQAVGNRNRTFRAIAANPSLKRQAIVANPSLISQATVARASRKTVARVTIRRAITRPAKRAAGNKAK